VADHATTPPKEALTVVLVDFVRFLAMLIVAGALLRLAQGKLANTQLGAALAFVY